MVQRDPHDHVRATSPVANENAAPVDSSSSGESRGPYKVRYSDFTTVTRSHSVTPPTRDADDIARRAIRLFERTEAGTRPVRLLGVAMHNLVDPDSHEHHEADLPLFDEID